MTIDLPRAAAALLEARRTGKPAGPLPPGLAPQTEAEGNALQFAYAGLVGAVPPAGFKIGATAKRMQDYLGLTRPAVGFMAAAGLHRSGTSLPFAGFRGGGVECEIGGRLPREPPPGGPRGGQGMRVGSVAPPIWLDGLCEVCVAFDGLGEVVLRLT